MKCPFIPRAAGQWRCFSIAFSFTDSTSLCAALLQREERGTSHSNFGVRMTQWPPRGRERLTGRAKLALTTHSQSASACTPSSYASNGSVREQVNRFGRFHSYCIFRSCGGRELLSDVLGT